MKILVADDEPVMLKTIVFRLQKDGYQVLSTENGREALSMIEAEQPDLVITDIMMPYVSGLEIVASIKALAQPVPVIVLSAMGQEKVVLDAFNLGADDFITKPFSPSELSVRVKRLLIRRP